MSHSKAVILALSALLIAPLTANAALVTYDIDWTGLRGASMTGEFSFDDGSAADGTVRDRDGDLLSLSISTPDFGGLSWVWNTDATDPFNFNFDALLELFPVNGAEGSVEAQSWNGRGAGVGLGVEGTSGRSGLLIDGTFVDGTQTLTVTRRVEVAEPAALALLGIGLLAMGFARCRRPH